VFFVLFARATSWLIGIECSNSSHIMNLIHMKENSFKKENNIDLAFS